LHNEEFHSLHSSPDIIRVIKSKRMRWAGHVVCMVKIMRNAGKILVAKPEGKRPLRTPRNRWEDYIKLDIRKTGFGDVDWIHMAQDRDRWWAVVNTVMNLQVP
jgi:hypothetical protein